MKRSRNNQKEPNETSVNKLEKQILKIEKLLIN